MKMIRSTNKNEIRVTNKTAELLVINTVENKPANVLTTFSNVLPAQYSSIEVGYPERLYCEYNSGRIYDYDAVLIVNSGTNVPKKVYDIVEVLAYSQIPVYFDNENVAAMFDKLVKGYESWKYELGWTAAAIFYMSNITADHRLHRAVGE